MIESVANEHEAGSWQRALLRKNRCLKTTLVTTFLKITFKGFLCGLKRKKHD